MHGWRIDTNGVRGVIASVVRAGESLSQHDRDAQRLAEAAPTVFRPADRVAAAVSSLLDARGDDVEVAAERSRRVLEGAAEATRAYLEGDEAMAVQSEASAAAVLGAR